MTRVLVQNGLGLYTAWVTIATLLHMDILLVYVVGLSQAAAGTMSLSIMLIFIISWFFLELTVFDTYLRYLLSPYIAIFVALVGSIVENWDPERGSSVLEVVALATSILLAIIQTIVMLVRHKTHPIYWKEETILSWRTTGSYGSMSKSYDKMILC